MLLMSTFLNKDILVANFERKSRYIQIHLFGTLKIGKEYASYFFLPYHKADIPKEALLLNNFVKLAKLGPNCIHKMAPEEEEIKRKKEKSITTNLQKQSETCNLVPVWQA